MRRDAAAEREEDAHHRGTGGQREGFPHEGLLRAAQEF